MWALLAFLSAVSKGLSPIAVRQISGLSAVRTSTYAQYWAALLIFPAFLLVEIPLTLDFIAPTLITTVLNLVATVLLISAIQKGEVSWVLPFLALTPALIIVTEYFIRGDIVSQESLIGILIIVAGSLFIGSNSLKEVIVLKGAHRAISDPNVLKAIGVAVLYSVSSVYDKNATLASDPITFVWVAIMLKALAFMGIVKAGSLFGGKKSVSLSRKQTYIFCLIGALIIGEAFFQMWAIVSANASEVLAIKRLSVGITAILGFIVLGEKATLYKVIGIALMIAGSISVYQ